MDTSAVGVGKRFREELLRHDIPSESEAARRVKVDQQWLSRRLTGQTDWKVAELSDICHKLGLSYVYIVTGLDGDAQRSIPVESLMRLITDALSNGGPSGKRDDVRDYARDIGASDGDHRFKKGSEGA